MDIWFTRSLDRRDPTLVMREDGVRLSVPVFGRLEPIPHDLAHYVVEHELGMHDGFWGRVSDGAIFEGMHVLDGRKRPHARERSRTIITANHHAILLAELLVDAALRADSSDSPPDLYLYGESTAVRARTRAERLALLARLRSAAAEMCDRWRAVPMGGKLLVVWPDQDVRARRRA
jgi:hypothetical protein